MINKKQYLKEFPNSLLFCKILFRLKMNRSIKIKEYKDQKILNYLKKEYGYVFDEQIAYDSYKNGEKVIWTMWDSGIENAPDIVKMCYQSMQKYKPNGYKVVVIDRKNYSDYVELPSYIIDKYEKGIITATHFSDILRVELLRKYGGLWLDSTVLVTNNIPESIINTDFFSIKGHGLGLLPFSGDNWALFVLSTHPQSIVIEYLHRLLWEYWKNHNVMIDYYLIDYCLGLIVRQCSQVKIYVEENLDNNTKVFKLSDMLEQCNSNDRVLSLLKSPTYLYKLTYKREYSVEGIEFLKKEVLE